MSKMVRIMHIDPLTLGKVNTMFGLVVGLVVGVLTLLTSGLVSGYLQTLTGIDPTIIERTQQLGFYGLIFSLLVGVILGFVSGALAAVIYNVVVKIIGPLHIEIDD